MAIFPSFAPRDWGKAAFAGGILQIRTEASNSTILASFFHTTGKSTLLTFLAQLEARKIRDLTGEAEIKIFKWLGIWNKYLISWASPAVHFSWAFPFHKFWHLFAAAKAITVHAANTKIQIRGRDLMCSSLTSKAQLRIPLCVELHQVHCFLFWPIQV